MGEGVQEQALSNQYLNKASPFSSTRLSSFFWVLERGQCELGHVPASGPEQPRRGGGVEESWLASSARLSATLHARAGGRAPHTTHVTPLAPPH